MCHWIHYNTPFKAWPFNYFESLLAKWGFALQGYVPTTNTLEYLSALIVCWNATIRELIIERNIQTGKEAGRRFLSLEARLQNYWRIPGLIADVEYLLGNIQLETYANLEENAIIGRLTTIPYVRLKTKPDSHRDKYAEYCQFIISFESRGGHAMLHTGNSQDTP